MTYDGRDRLITQMFLEGDHIAYEYDDNHNVTKITRDPKTGSPEPPIVQSFEYEQTYNQPTKITDPRGNVTDLMYAPGTPNLQKFEQPLVNGSEQL